ncbi:MAG: nucleotidyl transferase AbiEii/AbiGii toxin family protein [Deltaproteobacteria bacterium]|nr:nucleotidyl transferase AbiEii/AbiGii toxin family protein [Deltaproteobacteria bacterium]
MFEQVLSKEALEVIEILGPKLTRFYLAGGTGLALQLGHRKSEDLDFFTDKRFTPDLLLSSTPHARVLFTDEGTIHFELWGIRVSLLYYEPPLAYPAIDWRDMKVADIRDIGAEKIKTISQRGAKKDFIDLYAILKMRYSIEELCNFFGRRFNDSDMNLYHVLRSLVFFEDAEQDPLPHMLVSGKDWDWEQIKTFFIESIEAFEKHLIKGSPEFRV